MMKKKLVCILLVFALTAAGATACGTAGTDAGSSAQKAQTESSAGEEVTEEEGEKTEPDAAENLEVNEYGLTEEEWNLLMEKYRANLTEWVRTRLEWEASDQFDPAFETSIRDDTSPYIGYYIFRMTMAAVLNAGNNVSETIDNLVAQGENHEWSIQDRMLIPALAEWKNEAGIEEERLEAFISAMLENEDSFEETCLKPMLDELVQGA